MFMRRILMDLKIKASGSDLKNMNIFTGCE